MRIIAGKFRGRRLSSPKTMATRPTTDRVREAWFSILGPLHGTVVDLYAGTGALGFEALSRGADRVIFVENGRQARQSIEDNAHALGVTEQVTLLFSKVENVTKRIIELGPYDLILTDPPWTAFDAAEHALKRLLSPALLTEGGQLVVGHPKKHPFELSADTGLTHLSTRSWGDSGASFWCRTSEAGSL